ncbi:MAG TPA: hypothetical protein VGC34_13505, partial [Steroidobacteraceae bacterium]
YSSRRRLLLSKQQRRRSAADVEALQIEQGSIPSAADATHWTWTIQRHVPGTHNRPIHFGRSMGDET